MKGLFLAFALAAPALPPLAISTPAQTRPPLPAVVLTHMTSLDGRCTAAGGRPGTGRYVIAQDFTGDGVLDYLLSEGDYDCTGRPGLFRQNGRARVDIFVTDRANVARRVYSDVLIAYRVLAGQPAKVQIARSGAACGAGAAATVQCAAQLGWNGQSFGELVSVNSAKGGSAAPAPAGSRAPSAVAPDGQSAFLADCRAALVRRDAGAARWADEECKGNWQKIVASGPAADMLLSVVQAAPSERAALATLRQRATGVAWAARASAPAMASGRLGGLEVQVEGRGTPASVSVNWGEVGAEIPYDVAGAMRVRGVTLTEMACEKLGVGEGMRSYAGTTPGGVRFTLRTEQQTAPLGHMRSYYDASVTLDGKLPARGSTTGCDF